MVSFGVGDVSQSFVAFDELLNFVFVTFAANSLYLSSDCEADRFSLWLSVG